MSLPETPVENEALAQPDFARKTARLSMATLFSRLLGLVREQLLALTLGASEQAEAYLIAFRIPNLLRDLFAEGALSAAFIPTYSKADAASPDRGFDLVRRLLTLLAIVLTFLCGLGILLAPLLVHGLASGFEAFEGKSELATRLTRVMMPILPFISFAAVAMGMLNSRDRFTWPSLAPAVFNLVNIVMAVGLHAAGLSKNSVAYGWAFGALLGSAAQFFIQWPSLRREGFTFRLDFNFKDPMLRDILATMAPATIGLAAVQINIFISTNYASSQASAVAWLSYAFRLLYLPMGLFGVAVGTVAGARLSRLVVSGTSEAVHAQIVQALRLLIFLTVPSAVGLIVAGRPIVRLIYEHGAFASRDTTATASALAWMAVGLVAYASTKVLVPYFYAIRRPRVPLVASLLAVAANLLTLGLLFDSMGFQAAGLGMALGNLSNGAVLLGAYRGPQSLFKGVDSRFLLSVLAAASLMALVVVGSIQFLSPDGSGLAARLISALCPVVLGAAAYVGLSLAFKVPEASRVAAMATSRGQR